MKLKRTIMCTCAAAVLAAGLGVGLANQEAVDAVWHNLTAFQLPMHAEPWTAGRELTCIPYAQDSDSQYLDLYLPEAEEELPLFVTIHGGAFVFGDSQTRQTQWMYRYFRDQGYVCATVNYRLGQEAPFPAAVEDAKAAVRFLKAHAGEYGIDPERVVIWGESAGGYIASMAALSGDDAFMGVRYVGQQGQGVSAKVNVLVDYYGAVEFGDMSQDYRALRIPRWINKLANAGLHVKEMQQSGFSRFEDYFIRKKTSEMTPEERAAYGPASYVSSLRPDELSVIIVHGDTDITVPVLQSKRLEQALSSVLSPDRILAMYPHGRKHADDRLFTDAFLEQLDSQIKVWLFE